MYDVVITGAGAAGNYLAYKLAGLGYKVVVFEEHERIGEPVQCTGIIGAECLDRFPLFEGAVLGEVSSSKLFCPSGRELRISRGSVQAYVVDRAAFDRALAEKAQQQGAQYLLGSRVEDITVLDNRVRVETEGERTFEAKTVVIASGFGSQLAQRLGLGRVGDLAMGAQAEVSVDYIEELEVYFDQDVAPGFFAWFVPAAEGRALVGLFSRRNPGAKLRNLLESLFRQGKIVSPQVEISYGGIPLRPLPKTYLKRVIVVGDAAGQVKPTTGGGIYYGLLCAEVAVDTLHRALSTDRFSERLFSRYQKEWKQRIGRELRIGYFGRRIYERLTNHQIDKIFDIIESRGIHQSLLQSSDLSFDWHGDIILEGLKHLAPWRRLFGWPKNPPGEKR
ncbi:MAG: NAD(P)/FAD-dependent oxidoreductase [Dehalococcoidia bacterium]